MIKRYPILSIWVDDVNIQQVLDKIITFVERGNRFYTILASNPEKNFSVPKNLILYKNFESADLLLPDGIGVVLAARILHNIKLGRVTGIHAMQDICKVASEKGYKIFIYGAKEEINKAATENLRKMFLGIQIVGRAHGYQSDEEMKNLIRHINECGAQILFLALGSPKQEYWISQYKDRLPNIRVCQGVGGTLDVLAGKKKRAPFVFRRLGMEWLYRLVTEPKRWKRQKVYPIFAILVLLKKIETLIFSKNRNSAKR